MCDMWQASAHGAGNQGDFEGADARLVTRLLDPDVPLWHGPLDLFVELLIVILVFLGRGERCQQHDHIKHQSPSLNHAQCSPWPRPSSFWSLSVTSTNTEESAEKKQGTMHDKAGRDRNEDKTLVEPLSVTLLSRPFQVQYSTWTTSCADAGSTPSLMQDSNFCCHDRLAEAAGSALLSASDLLET